MSIELNKIPEKDEQHEKTDNCVIGQSEGDKIQLSEHKGKPEEHNEDDALPKEDPIDEDLDKELKKNLMFEQKNISAFKLYCHLSEKLEVVLMILGAIGSIGSGCAGPLMSLLFGDSLNDFGDTQTTDQSAMTPEQIAIQQSQLQAFIEGPFKDTVDDMVKKFLYIGVGMFCAEFLNNCMWNLAGLRQIYHLKEK